MKFWDANLQVDKNSSFTHPLSYILPSFSRSASRLLFSLFESVRVQFLSGNINGLLVIYLFNYNSSKSTPCWRCNWTFSWVQFLSNKLKLIRFLRCKITGTSFCSCSVFWYVIFYKNLIVLHHGDNNFLFYFDICIKFTLSLIISTMKKWHLTWCVPFYDKNMLERKKKFYYSKIKSFKY